MPAFELTPVPEPSGFALAGLAAVLAATEAEARKHPAAYPVVLVTSSEMKMGIDALRAAVLGDAEI